MMHLELDRDRQLESLRFYFDMTSARFTGEVLATRGERLALTRARFEGTDRSSGPSEIESLVVREVDDRGAGVVQVRFDPDDLDAAYAELDDRYIAGEAAPFAAVATGLRVFAAAIAARDWDALAAVLAPDLVVHDHRPLGWPMLDGPALLVDTFKALVERAPNVQLRIDHVVVSASGSLAVVALVGTREGGAFEDLRVVVHAFNGNGRICRQDIYTVEQLDEAHARFEAIGAGDTSKTSDVLLEGAASSAPKESGRSGRDNARPCSSDVSAGSYQAAKVARNPLQILPNAASRARDRVDEAAAARDWAALRALASDSFAFEDRRRLTGVSGDVELWIKHLKWAGAAPGWKRAHELIGTVGDRIALSRVVWTVGSQGGESEGEFIRLTEIDADGQLAASIAFDPEARGAAFREAQERFVVGEAAAIGGQAPIGAFNRAFARHDWEMVRESLARDLVFSDQRTLGMGVFDRDQWIESFRTLADLGPDVDAQTLRILAWNRHGRVDVARQFGTLRDGGPFETVFVRAIATDGDCIQRYELFDVGDADRALARFADLCADRA